MHMYTQWETLGQIFVEIVVPQEGEESPPDHILTIEGILDRWFHSHAEISGDKKSVP